MPKRPASFTSGPVKTAPHRFSVLSTIIGFEVIDSDGRPVAERYFQHEADGICADLNRAAHSGSRDLAATIGALV